MKEFGSFAEKSGEFGQTVATIQSNIQNLDHATANLRQSLQVISDNIYAVKGITHENGVAISLIAEKNVDTSKIADQIQQKF